MLLFVNINSIISCNLSFVHLFICSFDCSTSLVQHYHFTNSFIFLLCFTFIQFLAIPLINLLCYSLPINQTIKQNDQLDSRIHNLHPLPHNHRNRSPNRTHIQPSNHRPSQPHGTRHKLLCTIHHTRRTHIHPITHHTTNQLHP